MTETHNNLRDRLLIQVTDGLLYLDANGTLDDKERQTIRDIRRRIMEVDESSPRSHMRLLREVLHTARTAGLSVDGMSMALGKICDLVEPYTLTPHYEPLDEDGRLPAIRRVLAEVQSSWSLELKNSEIRLLRDVIKRASAIAHASVK